MVIQIIDLLLFIIYDMLFDKMKGLMICLLMILGNVIDVKLEEWGFI